MLASKIQDAMDQHGSKSPFKRRATDEFFDEHIDGSSTNKRLKVTNDKNDTVQMMVRLEEEEGRGVLTPSSSTIQEMVLNKSNTETQEAIQQSLKNMDRKNFRISS